MEAPLRKMRSSRRELSQTRRTDGVLADDSGLEVDYLHGRAGNILHVI